MRFREIYRKIIRTDSEMFKQFLLSLLATTISIVLTFGTAAVLDNRRKEKEKHEMVMMVIYDMYNTMQEVNKADRKIQESMQLQLELAENPSLFEANPYALVQKVPQLFYTETLEKIYSSNTEAIHTIDNILFTENVANFYMVRKHYKTNVCDSLMAQVTACQESFRTLKGTLDLDYFAVAAMSSSLRYNLQQIFKQCQQMMAIDDKELKTYIENRAAMDVDSSDAAIKDSIVNTNLEMARKIYEAKKKLNI